MVEEEADPRSEIGRSASGPAGGTSPSESADGNAAFDPDLLQSHDSEEGDGRADTRLDAPPAIDRTGSGSSGGSSVNIKTAISQAGFGEPETQTLEGYAESLTSFEFGGKPNPAVAFYEAILDIVAAFVIYAEHTVNWEGLIVITNAIGATLFYLRYAESTGAELASKLDFSILAFSVVFPLSSLLTSAFARREAALLYLAEFRAIFAAFVIASFLWDFPADGTSPGSSAYDRRDGRSKLPDDFNAKAKASFVEVAEVLFHYLSMPTITKSRNLVIPPYKERMAEVERLRTGLELRVTLAMQELSEIVEKLKACGMGGEVSRMYQYAMMINARINLLRNQKIYRTPQPTRSFGRVYLIVLPWFFGPYFVWLAGSGDTQQANEAFAVSLSAFTFVVLLGLINAGRMMEDPFLQDDGGWDHVHLRDEIASVVYAIDTHFKEAERRRRERESLSPHSQVQSLRPLIPLRKVRTKFQHA